MKLSSLLGPKLIKCGIAAATKEGALQEVLDLMAAGTPGITSAELQAALAEREKLGPFSMARGCAFPHARTEKVSDFRVAVATAPQGIDFKAPDRLPVRLIVLFAIPRKHSNLYLTTLAQFLNVFGAEGSLSKVLQAKSGEEFIAALDGLSAPRPPAAGGPPPSVTPQTTLAKALEALAALRADALPVVDAEGQLVGEFGAAAVLQLAIREHFLRLAGTAAVRPAEPLEGALRPHADASIESLGLVAPNGFRTVQEEDPAVDVAVRLAAGSARGAYVLRGKKLVGQVGAGEILRRVTGGRP
jgi:mannitol/fructose-specific phosphotransferase system IIA component (Ntr-type)